MLSSSSEEVFLDSVAGNDLSVDGAGGLPPEPAVNAVSMENVLALLQNSDLMPDPESLIANGAFRLPLDHFW